MFNRWRFENSQPDGIGVLEIAPSQTAAGEEPAGRRLFVPLRRTDLRGEVNGPLADLRLTQTFGYTRAQCALTLEAVYRFPLPGDAAVIGVRVRFGDVEIEAELRERSRAEADYEAAKQQGQQAALTTRESPDVFTLRVAGLQPDQDIVVETHYVQLAKAEGAGWSLRIPLTTSPRYVRSDEQTSRPAQGQPLFLLRDPGHRFALDLLVSGAAEVRSATHALAISAEGRSARVQLRDGEALPDRDCLLTWGPPLDERRPTLLVLTHDDVAAGQVYFLALAMPPAAPAERDLQAREAIVLVDHSGSMSGPKWEAADWAVNKYLYSLRPADAIALCLFHSTTRWFSQAPQPATEDTVAALRAFLESHTDSGGTELGVALEQALGRPRFPNMPSRHCFIITDAEVSDAARILRLADAEATQALRRRISVLCIDAAPNAFLASELAERGGGVARFLTSRPEEEDISTALDEVMADWAAPLYAGVRLTVNRPSLEMGGQMILSSDGGRAADLGDMPAGRPRWIAGRIPRGDGGPLAFRLSDGAGHDLATETVALDAGAARPALKALFGARRVLGLEYLMGAGYDQAQLAEQLTRLGYDPAVLAGPVQSNVYAENQRQQTGDALQALLVSESLRYGLACAETGFIAVRKAAGQRVEFAVGVPNALPAGWDEGFAMAMMPPATPMPTAGVAAPPSAGKGKGLASKFANLFAPGVRGFTGAAPEAPGPSDDGVPAFLRKASPASTRPAPKGTPKKLTLRSRPKFSAGAATLFDADAGQGDLPDALVFSQLELQFPDGMPAVADIDPNLILLIYVDDLLTPRARIRLRDLVQQGGKRPLNMARPAGRPVRVVLEDPAGAWATGAPKIELTLSWR